MNSRLLVRCCYLGMFIQALVINVTPLLFIPLREEFGLTFEQIGRLVLINFLTQMVVDLICCALADHVPAKPLTVAANLLAGLGLWVFALSPGWPGITAAWFATPYDGLVFGTVILAVGCSLLEVLLSPIINAVPSERKSGDMAILHAFYPMGKVAVILVTGAILYAAGAASWRVILVAWSILPFLNTLGFCLSRIPPLAPEVSRASLLTLCRQPAMLWLLFAMGLAGATEVTVAQWTSAFVEKGLGYSKLVADLVGFALFGVGMIAGRLWFGLRGEHRGLHPVMVAGAIFSAAAAATMALSPLPALALAACGVSGFFVSMLWPGSLSLAAARFPLAGGSMFALLAAAGDSGAALMPWGVGVIADLTARHAPAVAAWVPATILPEQLGLRVALFIAALCPLLMIPVLRRLRPALPDPVAA